jgi:hypothetical protein
MTYAVTHAIRRWMILCESNGDVPRLWLGPHGEAIDVEAEDVAHSIYVLKHQSLFDIIVSPDEMREWEQGGELDYDTIIARAEANGWVRTSRDTNRKQPGHVAISAANARGIARGLRWLEAHGYAILDVQAEIDTIVGNKPTQRYYHLNGDSLATFLRRGILPR